MSTMPRRLVFHVTWIVAGIALGYVLARYGSPGMLLAFLHKSPGCF
ncbi:MAG: hypothetical protein KDI88_04210 [Gammaproteobacteria bacterium]|nr:hypothetical protein [Gammaproteobacteria bacterium]